MKKIAPTLVIATLLAMGLAGCADREAEEQDARERAESILAALEPKKVRVEVEWESYIPPREGEKTSARITIGTEDGTEQGSYDMPLTAKNGDAGVLLDAGSSGRISMNAQSQGDGVGVITCRLSSEDGTVLVEKSSSGKYAAVSCSATVD